MPADNDDDRFYRALFSVLEQTQFLLRVLNIHRSGVPKRMAKHWRGSALIARERYQYTISMDIKNTRYKRIQSLIQNHMCAVSLLESREQRYIKAMNNNYYKSDE